MVGRERRAVGGVREGRGWSDGDGVVFGEKGVVVTRDRDEGADLVPEVEVAERGANGLPS